MAKRKKIIVWCTILAMALGLMFGLAGCLGGTSSSSSSSKATITDVSCTKREYSKSLDWWTIVISGVAENTSGKDYSYASISYTIYDDEGYTLGTAYDNIGSFERGAKWRFNATAYITDGTPTKYKLKSFTAY